MRSLKSQTEYPDKGNGYVNVSLFEVSLVPYWINQLQIPTQNKRKHMIYSCYSDFSKNTRRLAILCFKCVA